MITVREARLKEDAEQIRQIDASFTTHEIYTAHRDGDQLRLQLIPLEVPYTKRLPLEALELKYRQWDFALVATAEGRICGFVAATYEGWHRRLTIWHIYVDSPRRKQGIARLLVNRAHAFGIIKGARNLWLETSSMNVPAIRAYRKLGFELCGLDTAFYHGSPASAETALFFARPVANDASR